MTLIRDISDTARWVAAYRAMESERPDAWVRDPLARPLAGERGFEIVNGLRGASRNGWSIVARTYLLDEIVAREVAAGADTVVNLAAGFDARPYRLPLPPGLRWVEVDQEPVLRAKEQVLAGVTPRCKLERIPQDLSKADERRALLARIGAGSKRTLVLTEGLLVYLRPEDVTQLARDLAAVPAFARWAFDLVAPGVLKIIMTLWGRELRAGGSTMHFAPKEGLDFFAPLGWRTVSARSLVHAAAHLGRLPLHVRPAALLPDARGRRGSRTWSGICLLERS